MVATGLVEGDSTPQAGVEESAPARLTRGRHVVPIALLTLACLAFYLYHSFAEQARYLTTGYDLGIFDQAVRAYSHFTAPMVPLKGSGYDILGDHFHPIIAVLAPLYWIWDDVHMLFIAQALLTAASVPVVYRFARRRTGQPLSLLIAATYGFGWPIQGLIDFDFHEVAFATPLLALAIDALDRRDYRRLVLWSTLLLFVREDMGVLVALLGVLVLVQRGRRNLAVGLVAGGLAAYWLTTSLIIPHFSAGHAFAYGNQFGELGSSVGAAARNIVMHPWHAADVFFTPVVKTWTLVWLVLPFALLSFRSRYCILALPLLAERFFNSRENLWTTTFHYNALPWLVLTLAMVDGADRLGFFDAERRGRMLSTGLATLLVTTPVLLVFVGHDHSWVGRRNVIVPVTQLRQPYADQPADWADNAAKVVAWLPADVCVAADDHLVPHLTGKDWTTTPQAAPSDPDFVVLDMFAIFTGGNPPEPKPHAVYAAALKADFRPVFTAGTFVVLRSPHYRGPSAACAPLGPGKSG